MVISVNCPSCGTSHKFGDDKLGKKAQCKNTICAKVFVISLNGVHPPETPPTTTKPNPTNQTNPTKAPTKTNPTIAPDKNGATKTSPSPTSTSPPIDAEALAAQAFADAQETVDPAKAKIAVKCQFCEHKFEVGGEMEGRNVLCEECRQRIKVPLLKKETQVDWRKADAGKADILKPNAPPPENVSQRATVSLEAMKQAGAIPKPVYEPLPMATKIRRILLVLFLVCGVVFGLLYLTNKRAGKTEDANLTKVIESIEKSEEGKKRNDLQAAIHQAAGEYVLSKAEKPSDLKEAEKHLNLARTKMDGFNDHPIERQGGFVEIAISICSEGGDAKEIDQELRLKWDDVQKQVRQTLQKVTDPDLKMWAIRRVTRKLADSKQGIRAIHIARQDVFTPLEMPEVIGQVGLELLRAGQKAEAMDLLKTAQSMIGPGAGPTDPALTALRIALGTPEQPAAMGNIPVIPIPKGGELSDPVRLAYAEGYAFAGDLQKASDIALAPGNPEIRVRALLAVSQKAIDDGAKDQAVRLLDEVSKLLAREGKGDQLPWLKIRAVSLMTLAGKPEFANLVIDGIKDEGVKSWARFEKVRARLKANKSESADDKWLEEFGDPEKKLFRLSHAYARELVARHQAKIGENSYSATVESWPILAKAFGQVGMMLGSLGREP